MRFLLLFVLFFGLFLLSFCKKNKPADAAFFIRSGKISLATTQAQGTTNHKITDLWLYVNGKFEGVYPAGNLMPIVSKDGAAATINIFAGIKRNGISDTRISFNIFELLTFDTLVESGKTIERDFTFHYHPATTFAWTENFDSSIGYSIKKSNISDTTFKIASAEDTFEGKSMEMGLTGNALVAQVESSGEGFALPRGSANVYLELNYKCNEEFSVGLIGDDGGAKHVLFIKQQENWNKIYIQLSDAVGSDPISIKYKVYFKLLKKPDSNPNPKVFLDNVKLLYL